MLSGAVIMRRRLTAAALAALLLTTLIALAAGGDDDRPSKQPSDDPAQPAAEDDVPLREQVGEVMLIRFVGTEAPGYVERILRERRASGVILFADNAEDPGQLRRLTDQLQRAADGRALIAVDQEGGTARRLDWASATGQPDLATPDAAEAAARETAGVLRDAGVNVNFAPVADVAAAPGGAMSERAYPGDADDVAALTEAAVGAYEDSGVAPTLKHFPGFGRAGANTDDAPVTIDASRDELAADLLPFRAGIEAGAPIVMAAHALYPAYDRAWIASQSSRITTDLLRGELGFDGVVATDSMEADAVLSRSEIDDAAVFAIYAGCDLLVLTGRGSYLPVYERLLEEARRSPEFRARVIESAARVRALKRDLGP
jgi:beta-N-acetylhexosaminidase